MKRVLLTLFIFAVLITAACTSTNTASNGQGPEIETTGQAATDNLGSEIEKSEALEKELDSIDDDIDLNDLDF